MEDLSRRKLLKAGGAIGAIGVVGAVTGIRPAWAWSSAQSVAGGSLDTAAPGHRVGSRGRRGGAPAVPRGGDRPHRPAQRAAAAVEEERPGPAGRAPARSGCVHRAGPHGAAVARSQQAERELRVHQGPWPVHGHALRLRQRDHELRDPRRGPRRLPLQGWRGHAGPGVQDREARLRHRHQERLRPRRRDDRHLRQDPPDPQRGPLPDHVVAALAGRRQHPRTHQPARHHDHVAQPGHVHQPHARHLEDPIERRPEDRVPPLVAGDRPLPRRASTSTSRPRGPTPSTSRTSRSIP